MKLDRIRVDGSRFVDASGREVILRGVNLGGDCKVPYPDGGTHLPTDFSNHRSVSFVGRPFPLEEADEHFGRLRHWGFNCLRLLTTWEAVEHEGPGIYDEAYLDYFAELCRRAGEHGLYLFIDFHQDVWSRVSGGDGAPAWTFEAAGLDFTRFHEAGAAHVMQQVYDYDSPVERQDAYPQMSWASNYRLPANAIMWTLFWAGRALTPSNLVGEENVQDFLQRHYLGALDQVAGRLRDLPNILGFGTLNEPGVGLLGEPMSYRHVEASETNATRPRPGPALAPIDMLLAARGVPVRVPRVRRDTRTGFTEPDGETVVNPAGVSIWLGETGCPFEAAGAYRFDGQVAEILDENFFKTSDGRTIDLSEDGYGPFFRDTATVMRRHNAEWALFAEIDPYGAAFGRQFPSDMPSGSVCANHWYDVHTLYLKTFDAETVFDPELGARRPTDRNEIRARFIAQMRQMCTDHAARFGTTGAPSLLGEFGIPYDLDDGAAYVGWAAGRRDGELWSMHETALSLMYEAIDALGISSTQWNYTATNRNALRIGDGWNQEDLSIFSRDQQDDPSDIDSGGRAVKGFSRPYPQHVQGRLMEFRFDAATGDLRLRFEAEPAINGDTVLFLPRHHFPGGYRVEASPEGVQIREEATALHVRAGVSGEVVIDLVRA